MDNKIQNNTVVNTSRSGFRASVIFKRQEIFLAIVIVVLVDILQQLAG